MTAQTRIRLEMEKATAMEVPFQKLISAAQNQMGAQKRTQLTLPVMGNGMQATALPAMGRMWRSCWGRFLMIAWDQIPAFDIAATLPLYEGSTLSMLCATLLIVNCCKTHGVSNAFMNELLMLLSMSILPVGNCLPKTEYEASKILRKLGLAYNMIHACPNGCCLFKGDLEDSRKVSSL